MKSAPCTGYTSRAIIVAIQVSFGKDLSLDKIEQMC